MKLNTTKIFFWGVALFVVFSCYISIAFAQDAQPIPLLTQDVPYLTDTYTPGQNSFNTYLRNIYLLGIGIILTGAVLILMFNALKGMATGAIGTKLDIKAWGEDIWFAIALVLGLYVLLFAIDPGLTEFRLLKTVEDAVARATEFINAQPKDPVTGGTPATGNEKQVRDDLLAKGIAVNKQPCAAGSNGKGCTNVADLPPQALAYLTTLADTCKQENGRQCVMVLTGGTEPGHATHGPGKPFFDMGRTSVPLDWLSNFATAGTLVRRTCLGPLYQVGANQFLDEQTGGYRHWHVCVGTACQFKPGC